MIKTTALAAEVSTNSISKPPRKNNSLPNKLKLRRSILAWYDAHARALPWRANHDPYRVWLSEIMLQQTRVAAVIEHYHEFLRRFPTVKKLASAREASVLATWSGLGYYRRARMLHAAAKVIVRDHAGKFPSTEQQLRTLPGIGRYTAAAIASIAFGEPVAVVDGNVERVLQRVTGKRLTGKRLTGKRLTGKRLTGEELWSHANDLLDKNRPGDFNQSMMELGAVVCTPRTPACLTCPIVALCATRGELPALPKPTPQNKREIHYALNFRKANGRGREVFLIQRSPTASLMAGMWELPELRSMNGSASPLFTVRHSITVTDYTVRVWPESQQLNSAGKWIPLARLPKTALTGLTRKILRNAQIV